MNQITSGIRTILTLPSIYNSLQYLMGASKNRSYFVKQYIRPSVGSHILDIGCGTADILYYLPADIDYWGIDISSQYINAAKKKFGSKRQFVCGTLDQDKINKMPKFDLVLIIGALHHMDDAMVINVLNLSSNALHKKGRLVTIDPCFSKCQNPIARVFIDWDRGQNVRNKDGYLALAKTVFQSVEGTLKHQAWIPYTHWIMQCSK